MLSALETPFAVAWSPSSLAGRGAMAIALGRRSAVRDLAAVTSALAIVAFGVWLNTAGVALFPVLFAMLAMGASATFWWRGIYWLPDALSPALAVLAAGAGWRWLQGVDKPEGLSPPLEGLSPPPEGLSPPRLVAIVAFAGVALALAEDPAWLACLPGVALLFWSRVPDAAMRWRAMAAIGVASAAAVLPVLARVAVARRMPWAQLAEAEPPRAIALWSQGILGLHGWSLSGAVTSFSREFTPMGVLLILIGLVVLWSVPRNRPALGGVVVGLLAWFWLVPRSGLEVVSVPLSVCGWAAVAVALAWTAQSVRSGAHLRRGLHLHQGFHLRHGYDGLDGGPAGLALVAVAGVLLIAEPALTRARLSALGTDRGSEAAARMAYDFKVTDLPSGTAIIAESRRVDAIILLSSQQAGAPALIIPQGIEPVQSLAGRGRQIVAFANGRSNLERLGFLFERAWLATTTIAVLTGQIPCVALAPGAWPDVSLLVANGSFILYGATPAAAPGGVILRLADPQPVRFASIEPRSIPFEMGTVAHDAAPGIAELDRAARTGALPVTTLRIRETGRRDPVTFSFAAPPQFAVATTEGPSPVTLCPGVTRTDFTLGRSEIASATLRVNSPQPFAEGWHSPEADPDPFRWTASANASVRISMSPSGPVHVTITATPAARAAQHPTLGLTVNHCEFPARPMLPGQADYEWDVEQACWHAGVNQMWLQSAPLVTPASLVGGHDTRLLGARVGAIRLARIPPQ